MPILSHSEEIEWSDSKVIMEKAITNLSPESLVRYKGNSSEYLSVRYQGEVVLLDRSRMLQALDVIYHELGKDLDILEKEKLKNSKMTIFSYLSNKSISKTWTL